MNITIENNEALIEIARPDKTYTFKKPIIGDKGSEYFSILDPYDYYNPINHCFSFGCKIGNAIQAIRDGYGDLIKLDYPSNKISVVRYLNREIGEQIRTRVIEGFKDAKIGVCIAACDYLLIRYLTADKKFLDFKEAKSSILHFDSFADAKEFLEKEETEANRELIACHENEYKDEEVEQFVNRYSYLIHFYDTNNGHLPHCKIKSPISIGQYIIIE